MASGCVERWNLGWNYLVFVFNLPVMLAHLQLSLGSIFPFSTPLSFPSFSASSFEPASSLSLIYYISSYKCGVVLRGSPLLKNRMARTFCVQVSHPTVYITAVSKHTEKKYVYPENIQICPLVSVLQQGNMVTMHSSLFVMYHVSL